MYGWCPAKTPTDFDGSHCIHWWGPDGWGQEDPCCYCDTPLPTATCDRTKYMEPHPEWETPMAAPNRNTPYDSNTLGDNTGQFFTMTPQAPTGGRPGESKLFVNPKILPCPVCGGELWRIIADDDPDSGLIQMRCGSRDCRTWLKPAQLQLPQMNEHRAKATGLWTPDGNQVVMVPVEMDIDLD